MNKKAIVFIAFLGMLFVPPLYTLAQDVPVLTATLDASTPAAQNLQVGASFVDVARITLTASVGDVYVNGISVATDVLGGLSNFSGIYIYDTATASLLGSYPNQSAQPDLVQFGNVTIGNGRTKTYLIRATLSESAAGMVRVGFGGFSYPTLEAPALSGVPIYGNTLTLPGTVSTPTPTPAPSVSVSPTPSPSITPTPASLGFTSLAAVGLREGNTISAASPADPDIYIVNDWGYKRLFLNPLIFGFYAHLGGFAEVKSISSQTSGVLVASGLVRNCETNDPKVYGIEVTGEDTGILHWVNTSGAQAVQDDPDFFKKVFCTNSNEFNWYAKGSEYTSVNQVPLYTR